MLKTLDCGQQSKSVKSLSQDFMNMLTREVNQQFLCNQEIVRLNI